MAAASVSLSVSPGSFQERALENIKTKLKQLSNLNQVAKTVMVVAAVFIVIAALYTGYHNYLLVNRLINNKALALIPPLLMDGSLLLIPLAFFVWFTDRSQKFIAIVLECILFLLVGINTVLNGSYAPGQPLTDEGRIYVSIFITVAFLLVLGGWILIFHNDPIIQQNEEKAAKTAEAAKLAHQMEIDQMSNTIKRQQAEMEHQNKLFDAMHNARMKALESTEVQQALVDYEMGLALAEARQIRGELPLLPPAKKA